MSEEIIEKIKEACSTVNDPHMGVSIVEMGILEILQLMVKCNTNYPTN